MIKPILELGNESLRKKSSPVEDFQDKNLTCLIEDMNNTLTDAQKRFSYGRGIAAPQIGVLKRTIFIDLAKFKGPLINPKIAQKSNRQFKVWDSCLSFNVAFFVLVNRHYSIKVEYVDLEGKKYSINAEDKLSELLQHEIDHLDGILATDRMRDNKKIMMRSEWERVFKKPY